MKLEIPKYIITFQNGLHLEKKSEQLEHITSLFDETKITLHKIRANFMNLSELQLKKPAMVIDRERESIEKEINVIRDFAKLNITEFDITYKDFSDRVHAFELENIKHSNEKISKLQYLSRINGSFIAAIDKLKLMFEPHLETINNSVQLNKKMDLTDRSKADDAFNHRREDIISCFDSITEKLSNINGRIRERIVQEKAATISLF